MAPNPKATGLVLAAAMTLLLAPPSEATALPPPNNPFQPGAKAKKSASKKPKRNQTKRRSARRRGSQSSTTRLKAQGFGQGTTPMRASLGTGPIALAGFDFRFTNGDHKIKSVGVLRDGANVTAGFADNDGNDGYNFYAWYEKLASARTPPKAFRRCIRMCDLNIERPQGDEVFVLVGFQIDRMSADAKFERLALRPSPAHGRVRVEFVDGGGNGAMSRSVEFAVSIQYAYVPRSAVLGQYSTDAMTFKPKNAGTTAASRTKGRAVLQGFDVQYTGGGRFLENLAIEPLGNTYRIHLRDNSNDDAIAVALDYAILAP